ncbi:MAG: hypothetical protein J5486_09440, partial [Bacteroidaceae bacterium]|nr:hypothetical protein [Bacteroidaceae bacterium]
KTTRRTPSEVSKHGTAVCGTACTVVWEVGKREVGDKHFYQRLPPTQLSLTPSLTPDPSPIGEGRIYIMTAGLY